MLLKDSLRTKENYALRLAQLIQQHGTTVLHGHRTLDTALAQNPDLNFVISAGDQVNKTGKPKEEEYASYLSADALIPFRLQLPLETMIL